METDLNALEQRLEVLKKKRDKQISIMGFASKRVANKISRIRQEIIWAKQDNNQ